MERNPKVDWSAVDDVIYGCANQAGEDNRNVGRMARCWPDCPKVPGDTVNRLCGSSLDAVSIASRAIKTGEASLMLAGGVESMSRAPFVMGKPDDAFSRSLKSRTRPSAGASSIHDEGEIRHRFDARDGRERGPRAQEFPRRPGRLRLRSQRRAAAAIAAGRLAEEIVPVAIPRKGRSVIVDRDEHPRATPAWTRWRSFRASSREGTVTAGNASGVNDGAWALIIASEAAAKRRAHATCTHRRRAMAGVPPRIMGLARAASRKVLALAG